MEPKEGGTPRAPKRQRRAAPTLRELQKPQFLLERNVKPHLVTRCRLRVPFQARPDEVFNPNSPLPLRYLSASGSERSDLDVPPGGVLNPKYFSSLFRASVSLRISCSNSVGSLKERETPRSDWRAVELYRRDQYRETGLPSAVSSNACGANTSQEMNSLLLRARRQELRRVSRAASAGFLLGLRFPRVTLVLSLATQHRPDGTMER